MKTKTLLLLVLTLIALVSACSPLSSSANQQPASVTGAGPTVSVQHEMSPTSPEPTAVVEATIPALQCGFTISTPPGMYLTNDDPYSEIYAVFLENPEEGARNFVYVSVISPDIQSMVEAGKYQNEVYNYDPKVAETLLAMKVGESKSVSQVSNVDSGFTYERKSDLQISGYPAQTFENLEPWEFPVGTKELRYYISVSDCIYQIGGYMDTTESDQPGSITEVLFNEIVATIQLFP